MYTFNSKFAVIRPKKQVVKIRKIEADPDSDGGDNHAFTRLQTFQQHLFVACYSSSAAQAKYIYLYLCCCFYHILSRFSDIKIKCLEIEQK